MTSTIRRRLERLEEAALPSPTRPPVILAHPGLDASDEEVARFEKDVAQAVADGKFVIELVPLQPRVAHLAPPESSTEF